VMGGMTVLAYMVAINAHGPIRLSLSCLMATVMLAGSVWAIVQYVNTGIDTMKMAEMKKLEYEKQVAEQRMQSQADSLRENKQRMNISTALNTIITTGTASASSMANLDLQDRNSTLEVLMARAAEMKRKADALKVQFDSLKTEDQIFIEPRTLTKDGLQALSEAGYYLKSYYYSEDADQEQQRENLLRAKARTAYDKFQKASTLIAASAK